MKDKKKNTRKLLVIIATGLIVVGLIGFLYPLFPMIEFHVKDFVGNISSTNTLTKQIPYPSKEFKEAEVINNEIPIENRLVIPKIKVDGKIVEGASEDVLEEGFWRHPNSSIPGYDRNVVIAGHRYLYQPPSEETFYLLDELEVGDVIIVYWEGFEYDYEVSEIKEVQPEDLSILDHGDEGKLTLYTCSPLFKTDRRLVIVANPM